MMAAAAALGPSPAPKKALFVFSIANYFREMLPVAEHLAGRGYAIDAVLGWVGAGVADAEERCRALGFRLLPVPDELRYGYAPGAGSGRLGALLRRPVSMARPLRVVRLAGALVRASRPDVVLAGHYHSAVAVDNGIARECRRRKVLYCGLPVSRYVGERQVITARFNNLALGMLPRSLETGHSLAHRALAALFPGWTREQSGRRIFMFPPGRLLQAWLFGLLPPNPWQKPSEWLDVVFVEDQASWQMLTESGYPASKVVVSGKPALDTVFASLDDEAHVARVHAHLGLEPGVPFVLLNVEPSAEHHYSSWDEHWRRLRSVLDGLKQAGLPVAVSLHPLCDPGRYQFLQEEYGYRISSEYRIGQIYPFARLVVSFPCSTNAFAQVFGRPLVVYDFFGLTRDSYPTHDLYRIAGALYAHDARELHRCLTEALALPAPDPVGGGPASRREPACQVVAREIATRLRG